MNEQAPDVAAIVVKELKEKALASPRVPISVPPRQHYHTFPNGLTICFTLDILPIGRYWHLSLARVPGSPTKEELDFWPRAFFDEEPSIELAGIILPSFHFIWRASV